MKHQSPFKSLALATAISCTLLASCGDDESATESTASGNYLLTGVPADAAYLYANLDPMDLDVHQAWVDQFDDYYKALAAQFEREAQRDDADVTAVAFNRFLQEMDGDFSPEGFKRIGMGAVYSALYDVDMIPVVAVDLSDPERFKEVVDQFLADMGMSDSVTWSDQGPAQYLEIDLDNTDRDAIMFAILPDRAMVTLLTDADRGTRINRVLTTSNTSAQHETQLAELGDQYQFNRQGVGYVDFQRLFDKYVVDGSDEEVSPACREESSKLIARVPRFVAGVREYERDSMSMAAILALDTEVAGDLAKVANPGPGLGREIDDGFAFSIGFDVSAARNFALAQLDFLDQMDSDCEWFEENDQSVAEMRTQLKQPLPPFVGNVKGMRFESNNISMSADGDMEFDGYWGINIDNPQFLLGMGQAFVPELAEFQIPMDGTAVAIPESLLAQQPWAEQAFVAMNPKGLAFSVNKSGDELSEFLVEPAIDRSGLFMTFAMAGEAYSNMFGNVIDLAMAEVDDESDGQMTAEERQEMVDMLNLSRSSLEKIRMMRYDTLFTERGVEIEFLMEL